MKPYSIFVHFIFITTTSLWLPAHCMVCQDLFLTSSKNEFFQELTDLGFEASLAERMIQKEPQIVTAITKKRPQFSANEEFYDGNTHLVHNYKSSQEKPDGFDAVTMYRGVNISSLSQLKKHKGPIWVTPDKWTAQHYAAGHWKAGTGNQGLVLKIQIPRFLLHWSHRHVDVKNREAVELAHFGENNEEGFIHNRSIKDIRHFIVEVEKVETVITHEPFYTGGPYVDKISVDSKGKAPLNQLDFSH